MPSLPKIQFDELLEWKSRSGVTFRQLAKSSTTDKMTLVRLAHGTFKHFDPRIIPRVAKATQGCVGAPQFTAFFERMNHPKRRAA